MKSLIAVVSCKSRAIYRDAVRETWLPMVPQETTDALFFVGRGTGDGSPDVVELDCDDSYAGLPDKVRAIVRWALEREYSHVLKCDDDVVLYPRNLLSSGYDNYDFVGHRNDSHEVPVPPYGFCYWLSRRCMGIVAASELPSGNFDEGWVRTKLYEQGIALHHDPRYFLHFGRKEEFVPPRAPSRFSRPRPPVPVPADGTFAWCMYIPWLGYRNMPAERVVQEFKKVWEHNVRLR